MYDDEIRDVMGRAKYPHLLVDASLVVYPRQNSDDQNGALVVRVTNDSDVFARYVTVLVDAPLKVCGKLVLYRDAILQDSGAGSG